MKKILIVDSSKAEIKQMQGVLNRAGYWSVALSDTASLEQIIDIIRPNLILMDEGMPQRNGFQACRELKARAEYVRIPVVMVSAGAARHEDCSAESQGPDGYVIKPFTQEQLLGIVQRFL